MKARKNRELSEAEQAARKRFNGLTRRQWNAQHGKFAGPKPSQQSRAGNFEIVAIFEGQLDKVHTDHFPILAAATARFETLIAKNALRGVKLVENITLFNDKGEVIGTDVIPWHTFQRGGVQHFANSKVETLWSKTGSPTTFTMEAVKKSPALQEAYREGQLEFIKTVPSGGQPWWESHKERRA